MSKFALNAARFESEVARDEEVSDRDIHFSRLTGLAPSDIDHLVDFSRTEGLLIVIRCPKRPARYFHGKVQAKPLTTSAKSDPSTGLVTLPSGRVQVSDYDLMCVYRSLGQDGYEKIPMTAVDPSRKRGPMSPEASGLLRRINMRLKSRFQHGCQDDYERPDNPNVSKGGGGKSPDRFVVFELGNCAYFPNPDAVKGFYAKRGLDWPYDDKGVHRAARAPG